MNVIEIDSFIRKFHQLWNAGFTAHLDLDTHAGSAWVGLRVQLGHSEGTLHPPPHHPRQRGPSYRRRQERRQAVRAAADSDSASSTEQVGDESPKEVNSVDAVEANAEKNSDDTNEIDPNLPEKTVENSVNDTCKNSADQVESFKCEICDFESNWKNGLKVHVSRRHADIEQLNSIAADDKYLDTEKYWRTGNLTTIFQSFLDCNEILESIDLTEEDKMLEKEKVLNARKCAFGDDFKYYPPWRK